MSLDNENQKDGYFKLSKVEISALFESYTDRKQGGDIDNVKSLGDLQGIAVKLKTDIKSGLDDKNTDDLRRRSLSFDDNSREVDEMPSFWSYVVECLEDTILRILIVAAIVQMAIGASPFSENPRKDWIDGVAIVFAICVIVITTSVTNYSKEKKFKQMAEANYQMCRVIIRRSGREIEVMDDQILVGDVIKLNYGMIIPADGLTIESHELLLDEASITGESDLVYKQTNQECLVQKEKLRSEGQLGGKVHIPSSLLFSGTTVSSGSGWMLVLAVGKNSAAGKINESVKQAHNEDETKTPLELKLNDIAEDIGKFGLIAAILTLVALTIKLIYTRYEEAEFQKMHGESNYTTFNNTTLGNGTVIFHGHHEHSVFAGIYKEIISIVILCITIIVVAIPEGLPLAVTLSLSFSVRKMMDDNNLVRRMNACETMGGANYICTDKTGTLTKNDMSIYYFFDGINRIDVSKAKEKKITIEGESKEFSMFGEYKQLLLEHIAVNLDVSLNEEGKIQAGSKTDVGFHRLLTDLGSNYTSLKNQQKEILRIPFSSERRRISTIIGGPNGNRIHMKGAAEIIINSCTHYLDKQCKKVKINEASMKSIKELIKDYDHNCLRCIALAYKEVTNQEVEDTKKSKSQSIKDVETTNFTLIGIAAIKDGLKDGVRNAVIDCQSAGIKVVMVTGDNLDTAVAIAKESNIIGKDESNYTAIEGSKFFNQIEGIYCVACENQINICYCAKTQREAELKNTKNIRKEKIRNIEAFKEVVKNLKVIARARPLDKYALILGLREIDEVVAVTGDGTNDAPALSRADVGFAMGIEGTDAAKNAADIIIIDDNFSSIVNAVIWGRNIYDNIRKFIQFQLSVNLSSVALVFVCSWIGSESPISSIQMLWINLIMDSLGSLALATENPTPNVLKRKPYQKREYIISPLMWKHIVFQAITQFSLVMIIYLYAPSFIREDNPAVIKIIESLENCFGDIPGEKLQIIGNTTNFFVIDGRKSAWSPLTKINRSVSPDLCFFNNRSYFDGKTRGKVLNLYAAFRWYNIEYGSTVHMTLVFNVFVFYCLFNQINSRIIDDSFNVLKKIHNNVLFIVIIFGEIICQVVMTEFGGLIFKCSVTGLTYSQWGWVVGLASITFLISIILKLFNFERIFGGSQNFISKYICCCFAKKEDNMFEKFIDEDDDRINKNVELTDGKNHS